MIKPHPSDDPRIISPVRVSRHPIKWGEGHLSAPTSGWLSDLTFRGIKALGPDIQTGYHFINPVVTVSSRTPSATFFREALSRHDLWLSGLRQSMDNPEFRRLS